MKRSSSHQEGFTLLELMVALVLFVFVGLGAHAMLQSVIRAQEMHKRHALELSQLQKTMWIMQQDITQMEPSTALLPSGNYAAYFLRRGANYPTALARSDMLQVAYSLEAGTLRRYYWSEGKSGAAPQRQDLFEGLQSFEAHLQPGVVEITLETKDFGTIRRLFEVPQ